MAFKEKIKARPGRTTNSWLICIHNRCLDFDRKAEKEKQPCDH